MSTSTGTKLLGDYIDPLLRGRRQACRDLICRALASGYEARRLYHEVVWPALEHIERLYRSDRINTAEEHMATRINRTVAEHLQSQLPRRNALGKRALFTCAAGEAEEISAQMAADLFEADGWDVFFVGGGVPADEIASLVGQLQPDMLVIIGSKPNDAPGIRQMIDHVRDINACPTMNILVSGGVFKRAEGLWREVKADFYAESIAEALELSANATPRQPEPRIPGAPKKRRRRRRPPLLAQSEGAV